MLSWVLYWVMLEWYRAMFERALKKCAIVLDWVVLEWELTLLESALKKCAILLGCVVLAPTLAPRGPGSVITHQVLLLDLGLALRDLRISARSEESISVEEVVELHDSAGRARKAVSTLDASANELAALDLADVCLMSEEVAEHAGLRGSDVHATIKTSGDDPELGTNEHWLPVDRGRADDVTFEKSHLRYDDLSLISHRNFSILLGVST